MLVTQLTLESESGEQSEVRLLVNDWVDVQGDQYRYLAIDDVGGLVIRIIVAEYLACEVVWLPETAQQGDDVVRSTNPGWVSHMDRRRAGPFGSNRPQRLCQGE